MNVIVAGSRDFCDYEAAKSYISECLSEINAEEEVFFLSGGCKGADFLGERYAEEHGFSIIRFPADWKRYGKRAGPIRNRKMAEAAHVCICFWDSKSRGTRSMIEIARSRSIKLFIKNI